MTQFLESSCSIAVLIISLLELSLLVFSAVRFFKTKSILSLLIACLTFGLFYDSFIIALGAYIDPTQVVLISRLRFVFHGLLVPLLFAICSNALNLKKPWNIVFYSLTGLLMIAGLAEAFAKQLDVVTIGGIARMASVKGLTPAWAEIISKLLSFGTVIPLMISGIVVWIKQKTPFLFLSGLLMFVFSALGPATGNSGFIFYISMYGELLMTVFLNLYTIKKENKLI